MDTLDLILACRKYAEDPDHIVRNPLSIRETGGRGCIIGIMEIVGAAHGASWLPALDVVDDATKELYGFFIDAMREGQEAMLRVYDLAASRLAAVETCDPAHSFSQAA
jgi:hypothetical protein